MLPCWFRAISLSLIESQVAYIGHMGKRQQGCALARPCLLAIILRKSILVASLLLAGCSSDEWRAEIYPDAKDGSRSQVIGVYDSFEKCQGAAISYLRANEMGRTGSFLCGLNCKPRKDLGGLVVCETTRR
jgi:hypothetical protein